MDVWDLIWTLRLPSFHWQNITQARFIFVVDYWLIIGNICMMAATVLSRWVQRCVPKLCKTGKYLSALMLFSAPIFWGFFGFFYHKKVSQYYIINLRKSFSLSSLLSFLGIFLFFLFYSHNYDNRARSSDSLARKCIWSCWLKFGGSKIDDGEGPTRIKAKSWETKMEIGKTEMKAKITIPTRRPGWQGGSLLHGRSRL